MRKLDVQARLEYARCAVAVLRALKIVDKKMSYKDLGKAVGLISDPEVWEPWHQQQARDILNIAAAVEDQAASTPTEPIEFDRIINDKKGEPGEGILKKSKIVRRAKASKRATRQDPGWTFIT
jgi:hypothetical protein